MGRTNALEEVAKLDKEPDRQNGRQQSRWPPEKVGFKIL
jgi:hypothetical protein